MRRFLSLTVVHVFLLALMLTGMFTITASAASNECDGFTYEVHSGKATITGCTLENNYYMDIPQALDGYPVVSIGEHAFEDHTELIEVTIPEGVETIGDHAFYQCSNLSSIYLPDSLMSIGKEAFCNCNSLVTVEFGDGLKSIGYGAFSFCTSLDFYLNLPDGLEIIEGAAFYRCDTLETVLLPSSLKELGGKAFALCRRLSYIYIPDGIPKIGPMLLYESGCYYDSNNWYGDAFYIGSYLLQAKKSISGSYTTLIGITNIADEAFANCDNLTEVVLPDSLRIIGASAFKGCDGLARIDIPSGVTTIEDKAFYECKSATEIRFPDSVVNLGQDVFTDTGYYKNPENWENDAFYVGNHLVSCKPSLSGAFQVREGTKSIVNGAMKGLKQLTELSLPNSLTTIGAEAVAGCTALTKVTVSDSVTSIGEKAFYDCSALKTVHLGKRVSQIGDGAFGQCTSLESITASDENETYYSKNNCLIRMQDKCLVGGCKTSQIPTDGSVTSIGAFAFEGCDGLTEVTIPDAILTIGEGAFRDCNGLKSVSLGNGVQVVGKRAFEDCDALISIDLGQSVHTIDDHGFAYNHGLTSVDFPASLRHLGEEAFSNATGLVSLTFREGLLSIGENCFYFCENLTDLRLPDSLQEIKDGAFYSCENIATLHLGKDLTSIGDAAFLGCEALTALSIPDNVHTIGSSAFCECTSLQQVDLGNVRRIGYSAFESCTSLTQIHIPATVEEMGLAAFAFCPAMEQMTVSPNNPYYHSQDNCIIKTEKKYVAFGCKNSVIPTDGSVTAINGYAFAGSTGLKSIVVPTQVTRIYAYAFYGCSGLEEMCLPFVGLDANSYSGYLGAIFGAPMASENGGYVPSSLKRVVVLGGSTIGTSAFLNCSYLEEIIYAAPVNWIGYDCFDRCTSLKKVVISSNLETVKDPDVFATAPNAVLYITQGQEKTKAFAQDSGVPFQTGGLITFRNEKWQFMEAKWYPIGAQIVAPQMPENADEDALYWYPTPGICTGNQTIWLRSANTEYTVIFKDWDGTVLSEKTYRLGDKVTAPANPTRAADDACTYAFAGWNKTVVDCDGDATYTATYTQTYINYTVVFQNWDGTVLSSNTYHWGDTVTSPARPTRPEDANYKYSFSGWDKPVVNCAGNATYTATYYRSSKYNKVIFKDWDGTVLSEQIYQPGERVTAPADPTRPADEDYTYTFAGWEKTNVTVEGNSIYTATYTAIPREKPVAGASGASRVFGATRYETAFEAADILKELQGVEKFQVIVVACGTDFADALSGSYLANQKNAPILLVRNRNQEIEQVKDYIRKNLTPGGTVYLLGGTAAIPASMETGLDDFTVKRLAGATRYETNLAILREAGAEGKDLLVCTGKNFADGLSASAVNMPILLVKDSLSSSQKEFLKSLGSGHKIYIIGGTSAVNQNIAGALATYGTVERIEGATRYETSVNIAKKFFANADCVVLAYGNNFPDGLSGGPLAYALDAPLILTAGGKEAAAITYAANAEVNSGVVLGGTGLISDKVVRNICRLDADAEIPAV